MTSSPVNPFNANSERLAAIRECAGSLLDATVHPERYGTEGPKLLAARIAVLTRELEAEA